MGLARRNLENLEREKTVKIMQGFSFEFEEAKNDGGNFGARGEQRERR